MGKQSSVEVSCRCGTVKGHLEVAPTREGIPVICFCRDCQAAAQYLGQPERLDAQGGTHLYITKPRLLHLTSGQDQLACYRFSPRGPRRWITTCCRSPVGNTMGDVTLPFLSLDQSFIAAGDRERFPAPRYGVYLRDARGEVRLPHGFTASSRRLKARVVMQIAAEKVFHADASSPFVNESRQPIAEADLLSRETRNEMLQKAGFGAA